MRGRTNNKKKVMIAVGLGIVATILVFNMINSQKKMIENLNQKLAEQNSVLSNIQTTPVSQVQEVTTHVLLAKSDIKEGELITIAKLEIKESKISDLPSGYYNSQNYVLGKTASQDILAGKIITGEDIMPENQSSLKIPPGKRVITIPTSSLDGLTSYIYQGSKIDLLTVKSPSEFIVQNIKIESFEMASVPNSSSAGVPPPPAAPAAVTPAPTPAVPTAPGEPVANPLPFSSAAATEPSVPAYVPPAPVEKISADQASGITIIVTVSEAKRILDAMMEGKMRVMLRSKDDNKIVSVKKPVSKASLPLPPPPSGTGTLPGLEPPAPEKKPEIEFYKGSNKSTVSFDDESEDEGGDSLDKASKGLPYELKDLLKIPN